MEHAKRDSAGLDGLNQWTESPQAETDRPLHMPCIAISCSLFAGNFDGSLTVSGFSFTQLLQTRFKNLKQVV